VIAYKHYTDSQLLSLLRKGDGQAFTAIYDRYWKLLYYIAMKRLQVENEAEEVVQEVFTDIWARREQLQITRSLKHYLAAATQYQVMNLMARQYRRQMMGMMEVNPENNAADRSLLFHELELQIQELVQRLPEKCRLIYHLSREEGLNNKEIAYHLEIAEKTVENQLTKALSRIRDGLDYTVYCFTLCNLLNLI
jgi:RNA polymerase sigma-70 factor (ECF subfamily)